MNLENSQPSKPFGACMKTWRTVDFLKHTTGENVPQKRAITWMICVRTLCMSFVRYRFAEIGAIPLSAPILACLHKNRHSFFAGVFSIEKLLILSTIIEILLLASRHYCRPHSTKYLCRNSFPKKHITGLKVLLVVMLGDSDTLQLLSLSQLENKTRYTKGRNEMLS